MVEGAELAGAAIEMYVEMQEAHLLAAVDVDDTPQGAVRHRVITANSEWYCTGFGDLPGDAADLLHGPGLTVGVHAGVAVVNGGEHPEGVHQRFVLDPAERELGVAVAAPVTGVADLGWRPHVASRVPAGPRWAHRRWRRRLPRL